MFINPKVVKLRLICI